MTILKAVIIKYLLRKVSKVRRLRIKGGIAFGILFALLNRPKVVFQASQ
jgi:hypothetical protein